MSPSEARQVPARPKIYHLTHVRNLPGIIQAGALWADAKRLELAIDCEDLGNTLSPSKYPFLNALWDEGISGFLGIATNIYNFQPSREYMSKCDLCFEIRRYLVL